MVISSSWLTELAKAACFRRWAGPVLPQVSFIVLGPVAPQGMLFSGHMAETKAASRSTNALRPAYVAPALAKSVREAKRQTACSVSSIAGRLLPGEPVLGQRLRTVGASRHTEGGNQHSAQWPLTHKINRKNSYLFPFGERREGRLCWIC